MLISSGSLGVDRPGRGMPMRHRVREIGDTTGRAGLRSADHPERLQAGTTPMGAAATRVAGPPRQAPEASAVIKTASSAGFAPCGVHFGPRRAGDFAGQPQYPMPASGRDRRQRLEQQEAPAAPRAPRGAKRQSIAARTPSGHDGARAPPPAAAGAALARAPASAPARMSPSSPEQRRPPLGARSRTGIPRHRNNHRHRRDACRRGARHAHLTRQQRKLPQTARRSSPSPRPGERRSRLRLLDAHDLFRAMPGSATE